MDDVFLGPRKETINNKILEGQLRGWSMVRERENKEEQICNVPEEEFLLVKRVSPLPRKRIQCGDRFPSNRGELSFL
jgi:hypothetical protein